MERRGFRRVSLDLAAEVVLDSGARVPVQILDLSDGGAQIECDALSSAIIAPGANCLDPKGRPIELNLSCCLSDVALLLRCRVIFVRRVSRDEYRIGLRYADPLQTELVALRRYIYGF